MGRHTGRWKDRMTQASILTDRQTQTDNMADRQTDTYTNTQTCIYRLQTDRHTKTHTDKQIDRSGQTRRHIETQTDSQTDE